MKPTLRFDFLTFDSAAAERFCGVSQEKQRNWRRDGYIAKVQGHARYNVIDLSELWILGTLTRLQVWPSSVSEHSRSSAVAMAWWALRLQSAYSGEFDDAPFSSVMKGKGLASWERRSRYLADMAIAGVEDPREPQEILYGFQDGTWGPSIGSMFHDRSFDPKRGAYIHLDLRINAGFLLDAIGGPVVHVSKLQEFERET